VGSVADFTPLLQRLGLGVILEYLAPFLDRDGYSAGGKQFHRVASLQVCLAKSGNTGNCRVGTMLLPKGSFNAADVSCESEVTSWTPPPKTPGEIQGVKE